MLLINFLCCFLSDGHLRKQAEGGALATRPGQARVVEIRRFRSVVVFRSLNEDAHAAAAKSFKIARCARIYGMHLLERARWIHTMLRIIVA